MVKLFSGALGVGLNVAKTDFMIIGVRFTHEIKDNLLIDQKYNIQCYN